MCSQHLETFHKFYSKINEIQRSVLKEHYENIVLHPVYQHYAIETEDIYTEDVELENDNNDPNNIIKLDEQTNTNQNEEFDNTAVDEDVELLSIVSHHEDDYEDDENTIVQPEECQVPNNEATSQDDIPNVVAEEITIAQEIDETEEIVANNIKDNKKKETFVRQTRSRVLKIENQTKLKKVENTGHKRSKRLQNKVSDALSDNAILENNNCDGITNPTNNVTENQDSSKELDETRTDESQKSSVTDPQAADDSPNAAKRKRGRPKGARNKSLKSEDIVQCKETLNTDEQPPKAKGSSAKQKNIRKSSIILEKHRDLPMHDIDDDEGNSDNEFPARDSDNDDWPAQTTLDEFPKKIITNGLLLVKGKKLMTMICK